MQINTEILVILLSFVVLGAVAWIWILVFRVDTQLSFTWWGRQIIGFLGMVGCAGCLSMFILVLGLTIFAAYHLFHYICRFLFFCS